MRGNKSLRNAMMKSFVRLEFKDGDIEEHGSGILIWNNALCYILTAGHCIPSGEVSGLTAKYKDGTAFHSLNIVRLLHHDNRGKEDPSMPDFAILQLGDRPSFDGKRVFLPSAISNYVPDDANFVYGFPHFNGYVGHHMDVTATMENQWKIDPGFEIPSLDVTELCPGLSGAGIIDFTVSDEAVCVGVLRGFSTQIGATRYLIATPIEFFENFLKNWVGDSYDSVAIITLSDEAIHTDNYIQRYCTHLSESEIWWSPDITQKYTLKDYVDGNVDGAVSNRILLLGSPHTGKTYELNHLASVLREEGEIVVHVQIKDNIGVDWTKISINPNSTLIIDGLDEARVNDLDCTAQQLADYASSHPMQRIVVSCRENFITHLPEGAGFQCVRLKNLTDQEIKDYIDNHCEDSERVLTEIINKGIKELCTSPFNLISIIQKGSEPNREFHLPESRVSIFEFFIDSQFEANKKAFEADHISHDEVKRLMKKLAFAMVMRDVYELSEEEVEKIAEGADFKRLLMSNSVVKISSDGRYSFTTNGVREFLAAQKLLDYSDDEVKEKVCVKGKKIIRRKMTNTIIWWLEKRAEQGALKEHILDWIRNDNDPRLLLGCSSSSIPESTRYDITLQLLTQSQNEERLFSPFHTNEYGRLFRFAYSSRFIQWLSDELDGDLESPAHRYNIFSLCAYIPWKTLQTNDTERYEHITDRLLYCVERYAYDEDATAAFYWLLTDDHFIQQEGFLDDLISRVKDCRNPYTMSAVCALIYKADQSDRYVDYLVEAEKYVKDQDNTLISRHSVYVAIGNLKEIVNIRRMLEIMLPKQDNHELLWEEDEYLQMIRSLLSSIVSTEEGLARYKEVVMAFFPESYDMDIDKQKIYKVFEDLNVTLEISDDEILARVYKAVTNPLMSPEAIRQRKKKWQRDFDDLWNHEAFTKKIERLIELSAENPDAYWGDLMANPELDYNPYISDLVMHAGGWKDVDWSKVRHYVENYESYKLFRFEKTIDQIYNRFKEVTVSEERLEEVRKLCKEILENIGHEDITYPILNKALRLFVHGGIKVSEDTLFRLIPYSYEEFSIDGEDVKKSVFEYISEMIPHEKFISYLRSMVNTGRYVKSPQYKDIVGFLFEKGEDEDKEFLYSKMKVMPGSTTAYYLLDGYLNLEEYRKRLLTDFTCFSPYDQMTIFDSLVKSVEFRQVALEKLEKESHRYDAQFRQEALRKLVRTGSLSALDSVEKELSQEDIYGSMYSFSYDQPEALPILISILNKIESWDGMYESSRQSIYTSIGSIASVSDEALEMVKSAIRESLGQTPLANRLERYCFERRLDMLDNLMTEE